MNKQDVAAAELALKAYTAKSNPELLELLADGENVMREITEIADLTEAPEDTVCGLVVDLMHYCEREGIDWCLHVIARARQCFRSEHRA